MTAARRAGCRLPANSKLLRPKGMGRTWFSKKEVGQPLTQLSTKHNQQRNQLNDIGERHGVIEHCTKRRQIPCALAGNMQFCLGRGKTTASALVIARNMLFEARLKKKGPEGPFFLVSSRVRPIHPAHAFALLPGA